MRIESTPRDRRCNTRLQLGARNVLVALICFQTIVCYLPVSFWYERVFLLEAESDFLLLPTTAHSKGGNKRINWWRETNRVGTADHPHLGARLWHEGRPTLQNVVDPSPKRLKTPAKNFINSVQPDILCPDNATGIGIEKERGKEALLKIRGGIQKYNSRVPGEHRKSKILCMVYTADTPKSRSSLTAQAETWGRKCDGFFAASNVTDHSIGAIDLVHEGPEEYKNMWQKIRSMWAYAYDQYLEEYDFFHIAGDDVYVVVENLRAFLDGPDVLRLENGYLDEISRKYKKASKWVNSTFELFGGNYTYIAGVSPRPLYFGDVAKFRSLFPCGGPGYTLNRAALQIFGKGIKFEAHLQDPREDMLMGAFFSGKGIMISNVLDRFGGQRYGETAAYANREEGKRIFLCPGKYEVLDNHGLEIPYGLDGISEEMVAFHLKEGYREYNHTAADLMYRYHAILYDFCQMKTKN